ncbi:hypothetical protein [uncultured Winogradskyella sp.]|uniref:hypothetical protein n=1 Tax=uncultured Winogradskyella sp. TaxID=395353 RepID=UPI00260F8074|nr:hypothetical protein [uncultured Winogradskyella sp.]
MAVLRKIKASTLMETLIATVLIMVIFIVATMILNNLFSSGINNNTRAITAKLNEMEYIYKNDKITLPYYDDYNEWEIVIQSIKDSEKINIRAYNTATKKTLEKEIYKK